MSVFSSRGLQRFGLGVLRRYMPVTRLGKTVLVTTYADVTRVLESPDAFSVVPIYAEKMQRTSGDFYLGMDDTEQYRRERNITNEALKRADPRRVSELARRHAEAAVARCAHAGELDVVSDLSRRVPLELCEEFFGVPGPDRNTLASWMRYIFQHLFLNIGNDPAVAERAEDLASDMRRYLAGLIAERKEELAEGGCERQDFLTQLLRLQADPELALDDEGVARNVGGVILGSVDTISKCVVNALEELFDRPQVFEQVQRAARSSSKEHVAGYVFEALRFNPHNPLVVRQALAGAVLHTASGKRVEIPEGSRVFAMTYSAMFDAKHLDQPDQFRADREDLSHLQFGFGMHRCFGERLALVEVPEISSPLLALEGLERAPGGAGKLRMDGPFPDHLRVTFKAKNEEQAASSSQSGGAAAAAE